MSAVALNSYNKEIEGPGEKIKINYLHVGVFQLNICYSTVPFRGKPVSPVRSLWSKHGQGRRKMNEVIN